VKVFISWSGERSRAVAEAMREWLPNVIQTVTPWVSLADIEKGARWSTDITVQLEECGVGLICLTPENLSAPWLLFEAGALSKTVDKTFVCPYLLNLQPTDIQGPLSQFQTTTAEKEETRKLLHTINKALEDHALQDSLVNAAFEKWWPDLDSQLQAISDMQLSAPPRRSDRDLLEEVLETVRALTRRPTLDLETRTLWPKASDYRPGTLVRHPEWGLGVVQKQEGRGEDLKLTLIFRSVGLKVLAAKWAELELKRVSSSTDQSDVPSR
jgi:TIR domain/PcrA/UvrD tudor domain